MKKLFLALSILAGFNSFGQKNVFLTITPKVGTSDLQMGTVYPNLNGVEFELDHFDYYLSNLHIIHDGGQDLDLSDTVFLVEPDNFILYLGYLNVTDIEQINFGVGVPSNLNTSGGADAIDIAAYPVGHPLSFQDPSMHWGWTAGYMHMIIGGQADSNGDDIPNALFELHNLGDANYSLVSLPVIETEISSEHVDIALTCHVDVWLKDISIETVGVLHGTSGVNGDVMKNVETEVVFDQPLTAATGTIEPTSGSLFFTSDASVITVLWQNVQNASMFQLIDASGKIINSGTVASESGTIQLQDLSNGVFVFNLLDSKGQRLNTIKIVK